MARENRSQARKRRHVRVRRKVHGTTERPRLNVYRSINHIYAQVIDDTVGHTLVSASTLDQQVQSEESSSPLDNAKVVGRLVAERAKEKGIEKVVFDRGGYAYHGKIKALADASREAGLEF
ncbi:MAG: 50S ribosomal protein L18 [Chloroflexota bacterium]